MLEYPFEIKRTPKNKEMFALELLSAACSDEEHGTDYLMPLLIQHCLKHRSAP